MKTLARPKPASVATIPLLSQPAARDEEEYSVRPLEFRLISRLLGFTAPYKRQRNILFVSVILRALQLPALTWAVAAIINGPVATGNTTGVFWGAVGFLALAISTQFVMHYRQRYALELGEAVVFDLRSAIFAHLQKMPMGYFNKTKIGRIIGRMTSDIEDVRMGVQEVLFISLVQIGQMGVAAACMLWYDATLFLIVLALAPVLWLVNHQFHKVLSDALRRMRESFSRVTATLAESILGVRVTQGFGREEENARLFNLLVDDHAKYNTRVIKAQGLFLPLLELNSQIFIVVLLVVGGYRVLSPDSTTSLGELVSFFFMANMFFSPITILGNQYNQAMTAMAGAERLFQLLDLEPEWSDPPNAQPWQKPRGHVQFQHVTFGYDPARPVLHDVSFDVRPGQTIALVGHTGSGKSSIINLVSKFYLPTHGRILIDGQDLNEIQCESLRHSMGIVLQQNFLFNGTIADNVRFAKPGATDHEIREVCRKLGCLDFLETLPEGIHTPVGERGSQLSLGQRQMICFARAMIADPRILILDEATSSVDVATEQRLQEALRVLLQGRTSFVVAHRLSTIRDADQVLVLDHGHIIERGNHHSLMCQGGVYAGLYDRFAQAQVA